MSLISSNITLRIRTALCTLSFYSSNNCELYLVTEKIINQPKGDKRLSDGAQRCKMETLQKQWKNQANITFWHLEERLESSSGGPEGIRGDFMTPFELILVS